jgi:hypothetical protein
MSQFRDLGEMGDIYGDYYADSGGGYYEEGDEIEEEDIEVVDYGEEMEEKEIDIEGVDFGDNDFRPMEETEYGDLTVASFSDRERLGGPISSVSQIKSLMNIFGGVLGKAEGIITFANLSDEDIFKLILNNNVYANKLPNFYPTKNFTVLMEDLFTILEKIPNLRYKNPSALFIAYLVTSKKDGSLNKKDYESWKMAIKVLNIYNSDIIRYNRLLQNIYKS